MIKSTNFLVETSSNYVFEYKDKTGKCPSLTSYFIKLTKAATGDVR